MMILFTDFVPDVLTRRRIGDVFYQLVFINLGLNLAVIAGIVLLELFKKIRRYWIRR